MKHEPTLWRKQDMKTGKHEKDQAMTSQRMQCFTTQQLDLLPKQTVEVEEDRTSICGQMIADLSRQETSTQGEMVQFKDLGGRKGCQPSGCQGSPPAVNQADIKEPQCSKA